MIQTILIIIFLCVTVTLFYCLAASKSKQIERRWQRRMRRVGSLGVDRPSRELYTLSDGGEDDEDLAGLHSYFIGEISCRYNARSPYVRCAVNPSGPCENCRDYESRY